MSETYTIGVQVSECAQPDLYEFTLTLGGERVFGPSLFREVRPHENVREVAASTLADLLSRHERTQR